MTSKAPSQPRPARRWFVKLHRWLGIGAAIFWLIQAVTGIFMSFHFEIDDALLSSKSVPTDMAAVERRVDSFASAGEKSKIYYVWTTAGSPDRYLIYYAGADGSAKRAYLDGAGDILENRPADQYSFLKLMREIHIDLMAGDTGHWIMAVTGTLLVTNLIFGLVIAWPRKGWWRSALKPTNRGGPAARTYSWHRAIGLWAVIPAIVIAGTGTLMLFEHEIRDLVGAPETELPANPAQGEPVGLARAIHAAVAAIPGSRFSGATLSSSEDASYYVWVRAPGELYRDDGYGASLVIINGNDASVRGAYPITQASSAQQIISSFYPLHTGESLGLLGRILALAIAIWLATTVILGLMLWLRKRPKKKTA